MKRFFDLIFVTLTVPIWLPALLGTAVLVRAFIGTPVLFTQERAGLHGRTFRLMKFRTMTDGRDPSGHLLPDAQRLTRLGRVLRAGSFDELPSIVNLLRGEISLVGPRPLLVKYLPLYTERQARRHEVLPGVTGWAQVNGRNALSWDERFELDLWYVENRSFWLDLRIIWMTIGKVLSRHGVSAEGHATMEEFRGTGAASGGQRT
jgi:sugar transferase EpsL